MRKTATSALKHLATFEDAGDATTLQYITRRFLPGITQERRAIQFRNSTGDTRLQVQ
jgi:hypothetical protein